MPETRRTNADIYKAIHRLEDRVLHRIELVETKVDSHQSWIDKASGQFAVIGVFTVSVVSAAVSAFWNLILKK